MNLHFKCLEVKRCLLLLKFTSQTSVCCCLFTICLWVCLIHLCVCGDVYYIVLWLQVWLQYAAVYVYVPSVLWCCWLVGRKMSGLSKLSGEVLAWLSLWSEVQFANDLHGLAGATSTPSSLAPVKSRIIYLSGAGLPRLCSKKAIKWM